MPLLRGENQELLPQSYATSHFLLRPGKICGKTAASCQPKVTDSF